jgi:hypothetical protein
MMKCEKLLSVNIQSLTDIHPLYCLMAFKIKILSSIHQEQSCGTHVNGCEHYEYACLFIKAEMLKKVKNRLNYEILLDDYWAIE